MIFVFLFTSLCITGSRFIHFTQTDSNVFLFMAEQYSIVYMYHTFFIHVSVNGHLDCFRDLVIVHSAVMNTGVHVSFSVMVFSGCVPVVGLLGYMVVLFLAF